MTNTRYYVHEEDSDDPKYGPYLHEEDAIRDAGKEQAETTKRHEVKAVAEIEEQ